MSWRHERRLYERTIARLEQQNEALFERLVPRLPPAPRELTDEELVALSVKADLVDAEQETGY